MSEIFLMMFDFTVLTMKIFLLFLVVLLLLCLAPMPYGYFMLVRFVMMVACGWMAYRYYMRQQKAAMWVFVTLAVLFQPIYKIALGRPIWNVVDVVVAILLILIYFLEKRMEAKTRVSFQSLPPEDQTKLEDNKVEFLLNGLLAPKELIYVASEEDKELTELLESKPEVFEGWGKMMGFHVVYLPLLMKRLKDKEVLQYRAPYLTNADITRTSIGNDFLLQYLNNPADKERIKHGFMRTEDIQRGDGGKDIAINRFYPLSSSGTEPLVDQLHRISKLIFAETHGGELPANKRTKWLVEAKTLDDFQRGIEGPSWDDYGCSYGTEILDTDADFCFNSQMDGENIEDLIEEVKDRIRKLRQRGISECILEQLIHHDDRLSRLVITSDYRLLLPDYNNMEIKMEPLVKAVYLLFLKHPEGIMFKCLPDYRKELTEIYVKLKPYGLSDRVVQSIEDVTNPLLNSINEKCARIRGAFVGQFDNHLAKHYYIDGNRGEAKKIALPRDLVVWE